MKQYQDEQLPQFKTELASLVWKEVPLEIHWDEFPSENSESFLMEGLQDCYFRPVIEGLKPICADSMGKEALQDVLKLIIIENSTNRPDTDGQVISFENGTLRIDQRLQDFWEAWLEDRKNAVTQAIESAL